LASVISRLLVFMICFLKRPQGVRGMGELYHKCVAVQDFFYNCFY